MFKICKQNDDYVIDNFKHGRFDNIVPSTSNLVDDIILSMQKIGVLDCLKESFCDKRKSNSYIPMELIAILSVASKMKNNTSLSDIPYAIQDHRLLSSLGYNLINKNIEEKGIMSEGSIRFLINKFEGFEFIDLYNDLIQNNIMKKLNITPNIHILDCTKITVNINNSNYENSTIARDHNTLEQFRGYKLAVLRGIVGESGIVEDIRFGTAKIHDLALSEEMIKTTPCFHHGDLLIMDRGFISRDTINYLKKIRGVDTYIPLKKNMEAYDMAVSIAKHENKWIAHPHRKSQSISFVSNLKDHWRSSNSRDDVDFNACVVRFDETNSYAVFISANLSISAKQIVSTYELRPEIEEDFRQIKDFWNLEDFKSTKENFINFHIVFTLIGYLFFQLYKLFDKDGEQYIGKSLPCVLKNYHEKFLGYFVIYYKNYFAILNFEKIIRYGIINLNIK